MSTKFNVIKKLLNGYGLGWEDCCRQCRISQNFTSWYVEPKVFKHAYSHSNYNGIGCVKCIISCPVRCTVIITIKLRLNIIIYITVIISSYFKISWMTRRTWLLVNSIIRCSTLFNNVNGLMIDYFSDTLPGCVHKSSQLLMYELSGFVV